MTPAAAPLIARLDAIIEHAVEFQNEAYTLIRDSVPESDHAGWERELREYSDAMQSAADKAFLAVRELEHAGAQRRVAS